MRIKISKQLDFTLQFRRLIDTLFQFPQSYHYVREHRLWEGFLRYGWATTLLVVVGALSGLQLISQLGAWLFDLVSGTVSTTAVSASTQEEVSTFAEQQKGLALSGSFKYLTLIFTEIIIFHSVNRAIQIQRGLPEESPTFRQFLRAQYRMILVSLRSWFKEITATAIISAVCGILALATLKVVLIFIVQIYYVGFAMLDNYNERLGLTIGGSAALTRRFADVALGVGLVVYLLLLLPVVGALIGPLLGGVTATILLDRSLDPDHNADYDYTLGVSEAKAPPVA